MNLCTLRLTCFVVQNWAGLESEKPAFLGSPGDEDYMLRRAAIVTPMQEEEAHW